MTTAQFLNPYTPLDVVLVAMNLFNSFVFFTVLHPVASPLKKIMLELVHKAAKKVQSVPFLSTALLAALVTAAMLMGYRASLGADTEQLVRAIVAIYTFVCTTFFMKITDMEIKLGIEKVLDIEREVEQKEIVLWKPPPIKVMDAIMSPTKLFLRVESTGLERIPQDSPHLFVMNHSLLGLEMGPFLHHLYKERQIFVRGLADHVHFASPNGSLLKALGAVDGTRVNVDVLMESRQDILVYPGGGHEILKHSSVPRYELLWKERLGFARLAIKHGYPILPCAAVGTEDMLKTIADIPADFLRRGLTIPLSTTTPGKMQKIYFWFGEAIPTAQYKGDYQNDGFAREVRDKAKAAIQAGIKELQEKQENDPDRYLMDQFTNRLKSALSNAYESFCGTLGIPASFSVQDEDKHTLLNGEASSLRRACQEGTSSVDESPLNKRKAL